MWTMLRYLILHHSIISCLSEKAVEEAVRNCEQLKEREQEEDNVTIEELEKKRVEALEVVEKEREIVEQERAVYESIADKISKSWGHMSHNTCVLMHCLTHRATQEWFTWSYAHFWCWAYSNNRWSEDNNLCRQEQKSEKIWHLEKRVMEHRAEEMGVAETLTKTRSELKGLLKRRGTLSLLLNSEQHWIETVGVVSVCVCSNRWLTPSHRSSIMCSHSSIQTRRAHT